MMKTPEQVADALGIDWARGSSASRDDLVRAIRADRDQRPVTAVHAERDVEVGIWRAHADMGVEGQPVAVVVQIDTGERTGRVRVNLNEAPIWDGDPMNDDAPGAHMDHDPDSSARA